jgi:hypothetical protein
VDWMEYLIGLFCAELDIGSVDVAIADPALGRMSVAFAARLGDASTIVLT